MSGTVEVTGAPGDADGDPHGTADGDREPTGTATATATATSTATARPTVSATPTPTATPIGSDRTTPAPLGSSRLDVTPPSVTKLKLKAVHPRGEGVASRSPSPPSVTIRVKHGKTTVRTARLSQRAGTWSVTIRGTKIVRGTYTVEIEARDARGNRAPVQRKNVRVTR